MAKNKKLERVDINNIKPYWRNPRDNEEAVSKVKKSIEDYGYNSYITIDKNNIVITGHTRLLALKELGHTEIDVLRLNLTDKKAKEYRIVDNRTSEYADWNDNLYAELREIGNDDILDFFFDDKTINNLEKDLGVDFKYVNKEQFDKTEDKMMNTFKDMRNAYDNEIKKIMCPHCGKDFEIR